MRCIRNTELNPYFNLASEEYLLKKVEEECFMLWRNQPSVIVGKHQNTYAEINQEYVRKYNIPVVRRMSGGGTVFHDPGNLNYTFIINGSEGNLVNFRKYTQPIMDVLAKLGVDARFERKNDIRVNGKKISGNAEHVYKKRVLHHGTLLFSSALDNLRNALRVAPGKYIDNAVKSIRSEVANIADFLDNKIDVVEFQQQIFDHIVQNYGNVKFIDFTTEERLVIEKIAVEKYTTWQWNFGYSPQYSLSNKIEAGDGCWEIFVAVKDGIITNVKFEGNTNNRKMLTWLEQLITGTKHDPQAIKNKIKHVHLNDYVPGVDIYSFVNSFF